MAAILLNTKQQQQQILYSRWRDRERKDKQSNMASALSTDNPQSWVPIKPQEAAYFSHVSCADSVVEDIHWEIASEVGDGPRQRSSQHPTCWFPQIRRLPNSLVRRRHQEWSFTRALHPHSYPRPNHRAWASLQQVSRYAPALHRMICNWLCCNRTRPSSRRCFPRYLPPPNTRWSLDGIGQGSDNRCWLLLHSRSWPQSILERDERYRISWYLVVHRRKAWSSGWIWKHVA